LFQPHSPWLVTAFLCLGLFLMGLTYGPCGTFLAEIYPVEVRYTGASLSFNLAGILGAAPAPYLATWLAERFGLVAVGYTVPTAWRPCARWWHCARCGSTKEALRRATQPAAALVFAGELVQVRLDLFGIGLVVAADVVEQPAREHGAARH
jgi:MFS family permease